MPMGDIKQPWLLFAKGGLMLVTGLIGAALLLLEHPEVRTAGLLAISIWGFCRAYYFAFYVIEHYVDPKYKFSGLIAFVRYAMRRSRGGDVGGDTAK
jgi:hypothetical protein